MLQERLLGLIPLSLVLKDLRFVPHTYHEHVADIIFDRDTSIYVMHFPCELPVIFSCCIKC